MHKFGVQFIQVFIGFHADPALGKRCIAEENGLLLSGKEVGEGNRQSFNLPYRAMVGVIGVEPFESLSKLFLWFEHGVPVRRHGAEERLRILDSGVIGVDFHVDRDGFPVKPDQGIRFKVFHMDRVRLVEIHAEPWRGLFRDKGGVAVTGSPDRKVGIDLGVDVKWRFAAA